MLTWVDIETTGLVFQVDTILEVAVIVTGDRFEEIDRRKYVIRPDNAMLVSTMNDVVTKMHTKSGLLDAVAERGMPLLQVQDDLVEWYKQYAPEDHEPTPMCGSTIAFDRSFLKYHMPVFESMFSYRNIDVSTIKELVKRWCPEHTYEYPPENKTHRAMDDIEASIAEAKWYYDNVFFRKGV